MNRGPHLQDPPLSRRPLNLIRYEFQRFRETLSDPCFSNQLDDEELPATLPGFTWYGYRDDLMTLLVQRAILGVEGYLPFALRDELAKRGEMTSQLQQAIENPHTCEGNTLATNLFRFLPEKVLGEEKSLYAWEKPLYDQVCEFYQEVRNPLFHGSQFSSHELELAKASYELLAGIYEWIDDWHPPNPLSGPPISRERR